MSFKDILSKLDQLSEADVTHKGTYGTSYGKEDVRDQYGHRVGKVDKGAEAKKEAPKRGRGRPKKGADDSGEVKTYDSSALSKAMGSGSVPKKSKELEKLPKKKHSLKEYIEILDEMMAQQPIPVVGKQGDTQSTGAGFLHIDDNSPAGQAMKDAIGKMAQQKKAQIVMPTGTQQKTTAPATTQKPSATSGGATNQPAMSEEGGEKWIQKAVKHPGAFSAKAKAAGKSVAAFAKEKAHAPGTLGKQARLAKTLSKIAKSKEDMTEADLPPQDGLMGAGLGAGRKQNAFEQKISEGMMKSFFVILDDSLLDQIDQMDGAEVDPDAGTVETWNENTAKQLAAFAEKNPHRLKRKQSMNTAGMRPMAQRVGGSGTGPEYDLKEGAKPDFPDIDDDGNRKESISKAAQDAKKDKKKVKEGMEHRLKAAHHRGKAHALAKESYNSKYDDMEEARMYHEGYKEGLDECYGQIPIRGQVVGEMGNTVDDMASFGARTPEVDEGNAFTAALAKTPQGGKFSVGGKTFTDRSGYDAKVDEMDSMFESWDNQLDSLLEEYQDIQEGLSVSVSKGQQGAPDSVTVSAQDGDADKLLQLVKHAGLGLFGDEMKADVGVPSGDEQHGGVGVVGDHDGMMALMKKMSGNAPGTLEPADGEDYKDEEGDDDHGELSMIKKLAMGDQGEHAHEEKCNECGGAMEEGHSCSDKKMVDEVESEDQMEYEVAEDNAPDSGAEEFAAMDQEIAQDNAAASSHGGAENSNLEEEEDELEESEEESEEELEEAEEEIEESYANANDDGFQADIDFMTKIISGGLNKQKSTGQTTIPVIAGQSDRMGYNVQESLTDWKKLAGM